MGQQVVQVLWGIDSAAKDCPGLLADGDWAWESRTIPNADRLSYKDEPRLDEDGRVLGFRVAAGPAYDGEEGFLGDLVALEDFATHHAGPLSAAQAKWTTFAAWMETRLSIRLPAPRLFITTGERA